MIFFEMTAAEKMLQSYRNRSDQSPLDGDPTDQTERFFPMDGIRIFNAALDEREDGDIVLRGVIDPRCLGVRLETDAVLQKILQITPDLCGKFDVGDYQREILPGAKRDSLITAFKNNARVPDVELGMRGETYTQRNGVFTLKDPVFIVDGLQRITSGKAAMNEIEDLLPHLGASIIFNSVEEWERARFRTLNADRTKLSSNIHLRNLRTTHDAVKLLYRMTTNDASFVMHNRVQWGQTAKQGEFLTALGLFRITAVLLWRFTNSAQASGAIELADIVERAHEKVGVQRMRKNTQAFFDLVDTCWGLKNLVFYRRAQHVKQTFLLAFAEYLTQHGDFWPNGQLFADAQTRKKLANFPLQDPTVMQRIAATGSAAVRGLRNDIAEHVNSGRRTKRLKPDFRFDEDVEEAA